MLNNGGINIDRCVDEARRTDRHLETSKKSQNLT